MPGHDIIAIGASAGGVEALQELVSLLPADLPAAIFIAVHVPPSAPSVLPHILSRKGPLPAVVAVDHQPFAPGHIYVAPPDHHLLVHRAHIRTARGPRENGHRPAVDPLFRSAALAYSTRVVAVVLSGNLDDGTAGLATVKRRGGIAVVQDPAEALYPGMPNSALSHIAVDHTVPIRDMASLLAQLAATPAPSPDDEPVPEDLQLSTDLAELKPGPHHHAERPGIPSAFACPECGGALYELHEHNVIRFRCRTGHAYSPETLLSHQGDSMENALWTALRALEESAGLSERLADRAQRRGDRLIAERFGERARSAFGHAESIRRLLLRERDAPPSARPAIHPPGDPGGQISHSDQQGAA